MWAHEKSVETAVEVPKSEHFLNNIADGHESFKDHHWFYKTLFLCSDLELQIKLVKQESLREFYRGHFCQSPAPPTSIDCKPSSPNLDCIKFSEEIGEINCIVELWFCIKGLIITSWWSVLYWVLDLLSLKFTYYNWSYDSHNCKKTTINIDVLYILVSLSCDTERQISFLGYSHFIEVNYLWIPFVITFISCMIKFSHLINIAMELWRLRYVNRWNLFEDKFLQHAILVIETS